MLRGLYRFYLYAVFIAMLLFATSGVIQLLQTILAQTIFKDPNNPIGAANVVQAIVYAVVSLVTAALFGGLHYWLIRRDMRSDPAAGNGAVRAFFLNIVELISLTTAAGMGASVISSLGQPFSGGLSGGAAYTIGTLGLWAFIEWERRRVPASSGAAVIFQRLHLYGTQLILLFILTFNWLSTIGQLVDSLFFGGRGYCDGSTGCQAPNLVSLVAGTLWILLFWLGYGLLSRTDTTSVLRRVFHLISFGYGTIAVLTAIYRGVTLIMLAILRVTVVQQSISGPFAEYDVVSPLTLGLLVIGVYVFWLRNAVQKRPAERVSVFLTAQTIATTLLGISFWAGCGLLLFNILEQVSPSQTALTPENWATATGFLVTGIAYIPLGLLLRRLSTRASFIAALRGFVFALFGGGILAGAIGGATSLYAFVTAALGSPLNNWQYVAHAGLAALIVGVLIVGLYLWTSIREGFFNSSSKQQAPVVTAPSTIAQSTPAAEIAIGHPTAPAMPQVDATTTPTGPLAAQATAVTGNTLTITSPSVGEIVDELLAGKITRDEAVARIEEMMK